MKKQSIINGNHRLVSPTASLVAYGREFTPIEYSHEISKRAGAYKTSLNLIEDKKDLDKMMWLMVPMLHLRYISTQRAIDSFGYKNHLEIAGGILPRGLIMTKDPTIRYVHTDLPKQLSDTEWLFRQILHNGNNFKPGLRFQAVDATNSDQLESAVSDFNGSAFTASCEGFVNYLTPEERPAVFKGIHDLLRKYPGSVLTTPDFMDVESRKRRLKKFPAEYNAVLGRTTEKIRTKCGGRDPIGFAFPTRRSIEEFLVAQGFEFETSIAYKLKDHITFIGDTSDDVKESLQEMFHSRIQWTIQPK